MQKKKEGGQGLRLRGWQGPGRGLVRDRAVLVKSVQQCGDIFAEILFGTGQRRGKNDKKKEEKPSD